MHHAAQRRGVVSRKTSHSCRSTFSELITTLANLSFSNGQFPTAFKSASVTPLLKKPVLDKSEPANCCPISNINNISKIIECLFLNRFQQFVMQSPNFNSHQSAYRPKHSTETVLLCTLDKVFFILQIMVTPLC